jgi:protein O-GlcNAc transferase
MSDTAQINLGLADHRSGRFDLAISRYHKLLLGAPSNAIATYLMGMALSQSGRAAAATTFLERALVLNPGSSAFHIALGNTVRDDGDPVRARRSFESAVRLDPRNPESHNALGLVQRELGEMEAALRSFDAGLDLEPENVGLGYNRAMTLQLSDHLQDAILGYDYVLARKPDMLDAINNRARALHELGRLGEAEDGFRRILMTEPDHGGAWNNLGIARRARENQESAMEAFERALVVNPRNGEAHNNLGTVAWALGDEVGVIAAYERARETRPDLADASLNLAFALAGQGRHEEAVSAYDTGERHFPGDARFPVRRAFSLPQVNHGMAEIAGLREDLDHFLDSEKAREIRIVDPITEVGGANFYRVYHGLDDRPISERIAEFYRHCCPRLSWIAPHCRDGSSSVSGRRPRLGICSKYLNRHTIGLLFGGVIERLAETGAFELIILRPAGRRDDVSRRVDAAVDHVVQLPVSLVRAQEVIADTKLDVLLYTDIGMEPITYFLAFSRLAPLQFVTWGHPVTTGLTSLDGYLSADFFEPANGETHYTEGLRRLDNILMHYEPPALQITADKADFGLPSDAPAYVCPQNVFKLHPEFDGWLADILRADPSGRVVLIEGATEGWTERLSARLARAMPDVIDRVIFLPYLPTRRYFELLAAADVILDPIHFGGGNTTFHALGLGTPVVTTPGAFQRSRFASGTYQAIGLDDLIARDRADYVARVVALGRDKALRHRTSQTILDAAGLIQRRHEPADELCELLLAAIETLR